jgi:small subunit ribosomal protein S2
MKQTAGKEREVRLKLRRNNQFHRGGNVEEKKPGRDLYIHAKRNGKCVIDMDRAVDQRIVVLKRREKTLKKGESVILVGTTPELGRVMERRRKEVDSKKRIRVSRTWVSGMLTNYRNFQDYIVRFKSTQMNTEGRKSHSEQRWYESHRKTREGFVGLDDTMETQGKEGKKTPLRTRRPGVIFFRHPNEHGVGRKEAARCGVPTVGIVDSDCKYREYLTYPIPGNDESRSAQMTLIRRVKNRVRKSKEN